MLIFFSMIDTTCIKVKIWKYVWIYKHSAKNKYHEESFYDKTGSFLLKKKKKKKRKKKKKHFFNLKKKKCLYAWIFTHYLSIFSIFRGPSQNYK